MKLGKRQLLAGLLGLVLTAPVQAQTASDGSGSGQAAAGPGFAFSNVPPAPALPAFCPPGMTGRNIIYPFGEGTDSYRPTSNAFFTPREIEGPMTGPGPAAGPAGSGLGQIGESLTNPTFYLGIGAMAMRRTQLSRETIGELAPPLSYTSQNPVDLQSVSIPFLYGLRAEAGINIGPGVVSLSGFYLFQQSTTYSTSAVVDSANPIPLFGSQMNFASYPIPAGFSQSLWLNPAGASAANAGYQVTLNYAMSVGSGELNYRWQAAEYAVLLIGARYFDTFERLDIQTLNSVGSTDYFVGTRSRIVGPQIGFELEYPLIPTVRVEFNGKAAGGVNFFYVDHTLTSGTGAQGPGSNNSGMQPSGVFETGLFANILLSQNLRLHLGYQIMYILNVPEAQSQVNFNTTVGAGTQDYHGSYFFQGPAFDIMWLF